MTEKFVIILLYWCYCSEVRYTHYLYGERQGDVNIKSTLGYSCDWSSKSCASDFIQIPKVQIFNGLYRRMKVSDSVSPIAVYDCGGRTCYSPV